MGTTKKCTLLIATYNWPQALDLCLKSVVEQTVLPDEVLIADDGSGEATRALVQHYQQNSALNIKHVWHADEGFRKTIILNKAIAGISSDYIVQIDGDVILDRNFIKDHLSVAEQGCFVRGTRSHVTAESLAQVFKERKTSFKFYSKGLKNRLNALRIPFLSFFAIKKTRSGRSVRGCNLAYWKNDMLAVNGYNNDLTGWGHEDEELALRFVNYGLWKKSVKLKCIQYHIYHPLSSRSNEDAHDTQLRKVVDDNIVRSANGISQL